MKQNIKMFSLVLIILCIFFYKISNIYAEEDLITVYTARVYWNQILGTESNYYDIIIQRHSNGKLEVVGLRSEQYISGEKRVEYIEKLNKELQTIYPNGLEEGEEIELWGSTSKAFLVGDNGTTPSIAAPDLKLLGESNWQDLKFKPTEVTQQQLQNIIDNKLDAPINPGLPSDIDNSGNLSCGDIITDVVQEEINKYLNIIKIIVPILLILLGMLDFGKGVLAGNEDEIKKGQQTFVKRCMAAVLVLATPLLVNLIIEIINKSGETIQNCGIPAAKIFLNRIFF